MSSKEEQALLEEQRKRSLNMGSTPKAEEKVTPLQTGPSMDAKARMAQQASDLEKGKKLFGGLGELTEEKKEKMESFLQEQMKNLEDQIQFLESEFGDIDDILAKSGFPGGMDELKSTLNQLSHATAQTKEDKN